MNFHLSSMSGHIKYKDSKETNDLEENTTHHLSQN